MNDDLGDRLDAVERRAGIVDTGDGAGLTVFIGRYERLPEEYQIVTEPPEEDPIDRYAEPAIPKLLPPVYRGGITILDDEKVRELWDTMPEDVREREREYRHDHGEPIPPILAESGGESE